MGFDGADVEMEVIVGMLKIRFGSILSTYSYYCTRWASNCHSVALHQEVETLRKRVMCV